MKNFLLFLKTSIVLILLQFVFADAVGQITCPADQEVFADASCQAILPDYTGNASNCGGSVTQSPVSGTTITDTTIVTLTCSSDASTCQFTVNFIDGLPPTITGCPSDITADNEPDNCGQSVNWTSPIATDNCGTPSLTATKYPNALFMVGTTTVTYTATDSVGNTATCQFDVTVNDSQDPELTGCNIGQTVSNDPGDCGAIVSWTEPVASDNCPGVVRTTTNDPGTFFAQGTTTVTYTATDVTGNSVTCNFDVTVNDDEAPDVQCLSDITVQLDGTGAASITTGDVDDGTTDNCAANPTLSLDISSFDCGDIANSPIVVTLTAKDNFTNTATCQTNVYVEDNLPPVITAAANTTVECDGTDDHSGDFPTWVNNHGNATAADNCGTVVWTHNSVGLSDDCGFTGTETVTFTATDAHGNSSTVYETFTIEDTTDPTFTVPADITIYKDAACAYDASVGITGDVTDEDDNCNENSLDATYSDAIAVGNCPDETVITRTWTLIDECNNSTVQVQTITVQDNTPPTFTQPADITIFKDASCNYDASVGVTGDVTDEADNCDTSLDATYTDAVAAGSCEGKEIITRTWSLTDDCGNNTTHDQIITAEDNTAPKFTQPADITIYKDNTCAYDASVGVTGDVTDEADNCDTSLDATYTDAVAAGSCTGEEIITRTWTLTDDCGNNVQHVQMITVEDNMIPNLSPAIDMTVECDGAGNTADINNWITNHGGAIAVDNCTAVNDLTWTNDYVGLSDLCGETGAATVIFTVIDDCGNSASTTATFTIEDTTSPVITLQASDTTTECDGSGNVDQLNAWLANHAGATASDVCSGVTWTNNFVSLSDDCGETGTAQVIFTATDDCGNQSNVSAWFTIVDTTDPEIVGGADETVECDGTVGHSGDFQAWLDNHAGATATDVCSGTTVTWTNNSTGLSDDCGSTGTETVTFTAADDCGNTSSVTFTYTIEDNSDPSVQSTVTTAAGYNQLMTGGNSYALTICSGIEVTTDAPSTTSLNPASCSVFMLETSIVSTLPNISSQTFNIPFDLAVLAGAQTISPTNTTGSDGTITFVTTPYADLDSSGTITSCDIVGDAITFVLTVQAVPSMSSTVTAPGYSQTLTSGDTESLTVCSGAEVIHSVPATLSHNPGACGDLRIEFISTSTYFPNYNYDYTFDQAVAYGPQSYILDNTSGTDQTATTVSTIYYDVDNSGSLTAGDVVADPITFNLTVQSTPSISSTVTCVSEGYNQLMTSGNSYALSICSGVDVTTSVPSTLSHNPGVCGDLRIQAAYTSTLPNIPSQTLDLTFDQAVAGGAQTISPTNTTGSEQTITFVSTPYYDVDNSGSLTVGDVLGEAITFVLTVRSVPLIDTEATDLVVECDGAGNSQQITDWLDNNGGAVAHDDGNATNQTWSNNYTGLTAGCGATGTATVTFTLTDDCGNTATTVASITIEDTTPPDITTQASDTTTECDGSGNLADFIAWKANHGGAAASDACGGVAWTYYHGAFSDECGATGEVEVTFTATDDCGNTSTTIATFTIVDTTAPDLSSCASLDEGFECDGAANNEAAADTWNSNNIASLQGCASDDCGNVTITSDYDYANLVSTCGDAGVLTVTYTATDECGLASTIYGVFTIVDTTNPTITAVATDETVECDGAGNLAELQAWLDNNGGTGTATDECSGVTWTHDFSALSDDCGETGSALVTFTATDACDNFSTTSATFTIVDTTDPVPVCQDITVELDDSGNGSIVPDDIDNGSDDVCGDITMALDITSFDCSNVGPNPVVLTVTDDCGHSATCNAIVTVEDNIAPHIYDCPNDTTVDNLLYSCEALLSWTPPTFWDACGASMTTNYPTLPNIFAVGVTKVLYTVTDVNGNVSTCTFNVTVEDVDPPNLTSCPSDYSVNTDPDMCTAQVFWSEPTATDNCPGVVKTVDYAPGYAFPAGTTTTVTYVATDAVGLVTSCSFNVQVTDNQAPDALCQDITVELDGTGNVSILGTDVDNGSTDNCDIDTYVVTPDAFNCTNTGGNAVNLVVTDIYGNTANCNATVTVEDNEIPTITCPSDVNVDNDAGVCGAEVNYSVTGEDNCDYSITQMTGLASGETFPVGDTYNEFMIEDASGNTANCNFTVTVNDVEDPVITCDPVAPFAVDNDIDECGAIVTFADATATDNCAIATIEQTAGAVSGSLFPVGTTNITYLATDIHGNTAECSFDITVTDAQAPEIACDGPFDVDNDVDECGAIVSFMDALADDNCPGVTVAQTAGAVSGSLFPVGVSTITYVATDAHGNTATCSFDITVNDTQNPEIVCDGPFNVNNDAGECGAIVEFTDALADDNCPGVSVAQTAGAASGSLFPVGVTTITYLATDAHGNTAECSFDITVNDTEAPTIVCDGPFDVENDLDVCGAVVDFDDAMAEDNCPGVSVAQTFGDPSGSEFPVGVSTITYVATDAHGNTATCSFDITVTDTQDPTALCQGFDLYLDEFGYASAGVSDINNGSYDNCAIGYMDIFPYEFDCSDVGENTVYLYVEDIYGNYSYCSAGVMVIDNIDPTITCPADIDSVICDVEDDMPILAPVADDNCTFSYVNDYNGTDDATDIYPVGTTLVTWTVTDASNNEATCVQTITLTFIPTTAVIESNSPVCAGDDLEINGLPDEINCETGCDMPVGYCASGANLDFYQYIDNVTLGDAVQASSFSGYSDYTATAFKTVYLTHAYGLNIHVTNPYNFDHYTYAFIDWNRDGDFDDVDEMMNLGMANGTAGITATVTVPATATLGSTMMRIVNRNNPYADPCGNYPKGETEDYLLIVKDLDATTIASYEWTGPNSFASTDMENTITGATADATGTYNLTVTNIYGCTDVASFDAVVADPNIVFDNDMIYTMMPDTVDLDPGVFDSYAWNTGSVDQVLNVEDYGEYIVTVTSYGCTDTDTANVLEIQEIPLLQGWAIWSTYINNTDPIDVVMADVAADVIIAKDGAGNAYLPGLANTIGNLTIGEAYLTKMANERELVVYGTAVDPLANGVALNQYFNHLGYLRKTSAPVADVMAPIVSSVVLVKDYLGLVYWPSLNVNQIGDMHPGLGYKINMSAAATLTYPANAMNFAKSNVYNETPVYYEVPQRSGADMTIGIPLSSWNVVPEIGDEIAVFDAQGNIVGSSVFTGSNVAMSIWGADQQAGYKNGMSNKESLTLQLWHRSINDVEEVVINNWLEGDGLFHANTYAIVGKIGLESDMVEMSLSNYPNPFADNTTVEFTLPEEGDVQIALFNVLGEKLTIISNGTYPAGKQSVQFDAKAIAPGNYFIKLESNSKNVTIPVQIIK